MSTVLDLQRELWIRTAVRVELQDAFCRSDLEEARYAFLQDFPEEVESLPSEVVVREAESRNCILLGDHHALPRSQEEALFWLERLQPDWIALEWLTANAQETCDRWMLGDRSGEALLDACKWEKTWGRFPRRPMVELCERARAQCTAILALDHPERDRLDMDARERFMASRCLRKGRGLVLVGSLHLSRRRLPNLLADRRPLVLLQDHPEYWFRLQDRGEPLPAWCAAGPDRFVHLHTHPLLIEESTLACLSGDRLCDIYSIEEDFAHILEVFTRRLGLPPVPLPVILSSFDPEQRETLRILVPDPFEAERLLDRLEVHGSALLSKEGPLVLHRPWVHAMAEAAGRWYHAVTDPHPFKPKGLRGRFRVELEREFFAFSASLFLDPLRTPPPLSETPRLHSIETAPEELELRGIHLLQAVLAHGESPSIELPEPDSPEGLLLIRWTGQELARLRFEGWPEDPAGSVLAPFA